MRQLGHLPLWLMASSEVLGVPWASIFNTDMKIQWVGLWQERKWNKGVEKMSVFRIVIKHYKLALTLGNFQGEETVVGLQNKWKIFTRKQKHEAKNKNTVHLAQEFEFKVSLMLGWVMGYGSSLPRLRRQCPPSSFSGVRWSHIPPFITEMWVGSLWLLLGILENWGLALHVLLAQVWRHLLAHGCKTQISEPPPGRHPGDSQVHSGHHTGKNKRLYC